MIKEIIYISIILLIINYSLSLSKSYYLINSILYLYISLFMYIIYNKNSMEYIERTNVLGIDGVSISLILLLNVLYPILIWISPNLVNVYKLNIIYIIIYILFITIDVFIFFILFELILIPMFILISLYGSPNKRLEASYRFVIYTYAGSILMLLSILYIYIFNGSTNLDYLIYNIYSNFNPIYILLSLLLIISLLIKLPIFPVHIWLPIVHVESPTIGSVLLAGVLLKIASYGIYKFTIPLFNIYISYYNILIYILIIISIYYICFINLRQIDLKKIIAYSSIIHMNFTLFGLLSNDINGLYGALYSNISHGIVSSSLFIIIGILYVRYNHRLIYYYNNLATYMPLLSIFIFLNILHNISIPFSSSFISELFILISSYNINIVLSILLLISLLFSTIYNIWFINRIIYNNNYYINNVLDISYNEYIILTILLFISTILGIFPNILLTIFSSSILMI